MSNKEIIKKVCEERDCSIPEAECIIKDDKEKDKRKKINLKDSLLDDYINK